MKSSLRLLPKEALIKTGPVDEANWNFRPILGWIQRIRFRLVLTLLSNCSQINRLLEVGYGSGIFMPELSRHCNELYGVDIHPYQQSVTDILRSFEVKANLYSSSVESLPFDENYFDCVIAISSLEFVDDLEASCQEIKRVLKPNGYLILVTPGQSIIVDFGLKILTGEDANKNYEDRRKSLVKTVLQYFKCNKKIYFPILFSWILCLYKAFRLQSFK